MLTNLRGEGKNEGKGETERTKDIVKNSEKTRSNMRRKGQDRDRTERKRGRNRNNRSETVPSREETS